MESKITHGDLCSIAAKWLLRHEENIKIPNCPLVLKEVDCTSGSGEIPDLIGFGSGKSVLIEVKMSYEDFVADKLKPFRMNGEEGMGCYRYILAPTNVIQKISNKEGSEFLNCFGWGFLEFDGSKINIKTPSSDLTSMTDFMAERTLLLSVLRRNKINGIQTTGGSNAVK